MNPYIVGAVVPLLLSFILRRKGEKKRGLPAEVGGEPGYTLRNYRFTTPIESHWEGITTLAELFEQSCKHFSNMRLLGTRELIASEMEQSPDGRFFEKLHLGGYEWLTYAQAYEAVCSFASGLVQIGHGRNERVAIFADTRAEWQIALQGCFRRNVTVVTIYSSLGEEALCHSLNEETLPIRNGLLRYEFAGNPQNGRSIHPLLRKVDAKEDRRSWDETK